jgi:hypothetical protein
MYQYISSLLPENPHGSVLLTSNNESLDWKKIVGENIIRLDCPSEKTSIRELFLGVDTLFRDIIIPINPAEKKEAEEICKLIVNFLARNPKVIRCVSRQLFNNYVKRCIGDSYAKYSETYGGRIIL